MIYKEYPRSTAPEILYWKSIQMCLFTYIYSRINKSHPLSVPRKYRKLMIFRALGGFLGIGGMWSAVRYIPVSIASCIFKMQVFFAAILGHFFLKEYISCLDVFFMLIAFGGALIVDNPVGDHDYESNNDIMTGMTFAFVGAIGGSVITLLMRHMKEGIHFSVSPFFFAAGCVLMTPMCYFTLQPTYDQDTTAYDKKFAFMVFLAAVL